MTQKQKYQPQIISPYYSDDNQRGAVLHRYLDDQFMPRFITQAQESKLSQDKHEWLQQDRFANKNYPCLRLPIHRTFYVLCCEASCNAPGQPPLDRRRIESSGFVIRKQVPGKDLRWMVHEGIDQGWGHPKVSGIEEPDEYIHLVNKGYVKERSPEPAYSGERTYPLIPMSVHDADVQPERDHTLLYGFVPLGGQSFPPVEAQDLPKIEDLDKELTWPLGEFSDGISTTWVENNSAHSGHLVKDGKLEQSIGEMLAMVVERFHVFEKNDAENEELISVLRQIPLYVGNNVGYADIEEDYDLGTDLYTYFKSQSDKLEDWLTEYHKQNNDAQKASSAIVFGTKVQVILTKEQANDIRLAIARRSFTTIKQTVSDMPEPRFERDGIYYAKPFMRYRCPDGCLKIVWGDATVLFQVAAPFDPEASRPHLIQMPGMDDIKRGFASGAAMRVPKSLADVLESIKPDLGEGAGEKSYKSRGEWGWIYVFSIPIVTLCAMILLMILVSLLNFIFRWIPWVIMRIPVPK